MDETTAYLVYLAISLIFGVGTQLHVHLHPNDAVIGRKQFCLNVVRNLMYIFTFKGMTLFCEICHDILTGKKLNVQRIRNTFWFHSMFVTGAAILTHYNHTLITEDVIFVFVCYLIVEYPSIIHKSSPISYAAGMACNFYEGYLMKVIPSDGGSYHGFERNVNTFESREGIVIPVKKLFIIITKTMSSPPDLVDFNKPNRDDLAKLEACSEYVHELGVDDGLFQSLDDVARDVGGVAARSYRNTVYKIHRAARAGPRGPRAGPRGPPPRPLCVVAECATPLHTLHRVIKNKHLYDDFAEVNVEDVRNEFCTTLTNILAKSLECRDKVELVYYDNEDPNSNLADLLLNRIQQLEPNFEELINGRC